MTTEPTAPAPAPPPTRPSPAPRRRPPARAAWRGRSARSAALAGLAALAAWLWLRDPWLARAEADQRDGDHQAALRWAGASLKRHPGNPGATRVRARSLSALLFPDQAEPYYDALRARRTFNADDAHARALGLTRANRRDEAVAAYEAILKQSPGDPLALQRLAAVEWARGRGDAAIAAAEELAKTPEGAVPGHTILAEVHHESGRHEQSIPHYARVVELDPGLERMPQPKPIFWTGYAIDLLTARRATEARRLLIGAVKQSDDPGLMDLLGRAYREEGDESEAERWWLRSAAKAPERPGPWLQLGRLALRRQKPDEALTYLNRANDLRPDDYETLAGLASAHRLLGHAAEASDAQARADRARRALPAPTGGMGADAMPARQP